MWRKKRTPTLAEIARSCPDDPDDAMVPCAGASSDELTTSRVAPLEGTLIHSNKNRPQARPHSVHRAPSRPHQYPLLRTYTTVQYQSFSYSVQALASARRSAPVTNFVLRSHRRSRPPPPVRACEGGVCPGLDTTVGENSDLLITAQIPSMTICRTVSRHTPDLCFAALSAEC